MKYSNSATANWLHYLFYIKSSINYSISWKADAAATVWQKHSAQFKGGFWRGAWADLLYRVLRLSFWRENAAVWPVFKVSMA